MSEHDRTLQFVLKDELLKVFGKHLVVVVIGMRRLPVVALVDGKNRE
jgi:hypothetical protein